MLPPWPYLTEASSFYRAASTNSCPNRSPWSRSSAAQSVAKRRPSAWPVLWSKDFPFGKNRWCDLEVVLLVFEGVR